MNFLETVYSFLKRFLRISLYNSALQLYRMYARLDRKLTKHFQQTSGVADRLRFGRLRVTNARTDSFVTLTHTRRRFQTAYCTARRHGNSTVK